MYKTFNDFNYMKLYFYRKNQGCLFFHLNVYKYKFAFKIVKCILNFTTKTWLHFQHHKNK
jgi:hypothetical protein